MVNFDAKKVFNLIWERGSSREGELVWLIVPVTWSTMSGSVDIHVWCEARVWHLLLTHWMTSQEFQGKLSNAELLEDREFLQNVFDYHASVPPRLLEDLRPGDSITTLAAIMVRFSAHSFHAFNCLCVFDNCTSRLKIDGSNWSKSQHSLSHLASRTDGSVSLIVGTSSKRAFLFIWHYFKVVYKHVQIRQKNLIEVSGIVGEGDFVGPVIARMKRHPHFVRPFTWSHVEPRLYNKMTLFCQFAIWGFIQHCTYIWITFILPVHFSRTHYLSGWSDVLACPL